MEHILQIGDKVINYTLEYKKVKNINLRIRNDFSIYVSAPSFVSEKKIEEFIISKSDFIFNAINRAQTKLDNSVRIHKKYVGETFYVFGEQKTYVQMCELLKCGSSIDEMEFARKFMAYKRLKLAETVNRICDEVYPLFATKTGLSYPEVRYRDMKSRWGVCKVKENTLTFSYHLFETPMECIRYVVMHEFTHFLVPNHSHKFYYELSKVCPDYEKLRVVLRQYSI